MTALRRWCRRRRSPGSFATYGLWLPLDLLFGLAGGMTLVQLAALHIVSAQAPVTLTDLAQALGSRPPATSAMVDRLTCTGLVYRAPDRQDRRRIQLTITACTQKMIEK
jgi:DNA-binding MarR family transcriptional regulator